MRPWDTIENRESHGQTLRVGIHNIKHDHNVSQDGIATKVKQFLRQKKSSFLGKYKHLQATDWLYILGPGSLKNADDLWSCFKNRAVSRWLTLWWGHSTKSQPMQASPQETLDRNLAQLIAEDDSNNHLAVVPSAINGTNPCAFLCAKKVHDLPYQLV